MYFHLFSGSVITLLCLHLPLAASIKPYANIGGGPLSFSKNTRHSIGIKSNLESKSIDQKSTVRKSPPAAFLKSTPPPLPTPPPSSPLPVSQQLIVLPIILKGAATFLVPCTKTIAEFTIEAFETTTKKCTDIYKVVSKKVTTNTRRGLARTSKTANYLTQMCASMFKNCVGAIVDFSEHVAQGFIDSVHGTKAWMKTFCGCTYNKILMPAVRNTANFISTITENASVWFEDVTLFTFHFISTVSQDVINFITNQALDIADWIRFYSIRSFQFMDAVLREAVDVVFKIVLGIPIWISDFTSASVAFLSSLLTLTKKTVVEIYKNTLKWIDDVVEAAPFLIRYEENGVKKITLTPNAQSVLYIISMVYASISLITDNANTR